MSNDVRDRFKYALPKSKDPTEDILTIWDDQKKMQAEDAKIAKELEETKKKARELKRALRKHQLGDQGKSLIDTVSKTAARQKEKIVPSFSKMKPTITSILKKKKFISLALLPIVVFAVLGHIFLKPDDQRATLGESSTSIPSIKDLPREKPDDFNLMYPSGTNETDYDVVRISPESSGPSYTFLDQLTEDGTIFRVTQQKIPDNFNLEEVATEFQATSIIQVDDTIVYHGYSEKGGVQSLIFTKNNILFTIRSTEKFTDDLWASYVASFQ